MTGSTISTTLAAVGSNSLSNPTDYDRMEFDISAGDIVDHLSGRVGFWVYVDSVGGLGASLFDAFYDASNYIRVETYSTLPAKLRMTYNAGGTSSQWTTAGNPIVVDTWHFVEVVWNQGAAGDDFELLVDGVSVGTDDTATGTWAAGPTVLRLGEINGISIAQNMDQFYSSDDPTRDLYAERNSTTSHP